VVGRCAARGCFGGGMGESDSVVMPAASLRRYHPCEQRTLARDPVLRQSGAHLSDDEAVAKMGHPGSVVVVERDHASEVCLVVLGETTRGRELIGIAKCSEDAIPPGDVTIVELVNVELVMD